MADNNCFFKVLTELSDTEYFTFFFSSTNRGGGQALSGKFHYFFLFFLKPYTIISLILIDFLTIFIIFNLFQRIFRGSKSPKLTLRGEVNPFQKDPKFKKVPTPLGERVVSTLNKFFGKLPLAWMFVLSRDYIFFIFEWNSSAKFTFPPTFSE